MRQWSNQSTPASCCFCRYKKKKPSITHPVRNLNKQMQAPSTRSDRGLNESEESGTTPCVKLETQQTKNEQNPVAECGCGR